MNYLYAENLKKSYGEKTLFDDITISINKGQKVALIARNGTGKTSLLEILAGIDSSDMGGSVRVHSEVRIGYLDQDPQLTHGSTVMEAIFESDNETLETIKSYEDCLLKQQIKDSPQLQERLQLLMAKMDTLNAWDYEAKIKEILSKLKLDNLTQPVEKLSGGQRKRVALASILIQEPELMILDEPTNHLDIEMIEWLEKHLNQPSNTLLIVTHDRYFLDGITTEILELHEGQIHKFKGKYAYYLEKRAELNYNRQMQVANAQRLMKKELEWMRRQPKARGTKAKSRIDNFYEIEKTAKQKTGEDEVQMMMRGRYIGKKIVEFEYVSKKYPGVTILEDFHYNFARRDRVGIAGKNGAGKTTFLKLLLGEEMPDSGKIVRGETLHFGHYRQDGMKLNNDAKVIDVIRDVAEYVQLDNGVKITAIQLLNHFLFPPEMHYTYVHKLSGGEKRRLYLLTILMENPNFLILDEPTNDLDLATLNVLEEFLMLFEGCLVIVSHDRYFMDKLVDHLFVFEGDGKVRDFPGNYTNYRLWQTEQKRLEMEAKADVEKTVKVKYNADKAKTKLSYNEKREFEQLEKDLENLETEKADLMEKMGDTSASGEQIMEWSTRMGEVVQLLETKEDRWLELSEYV